jgi:ParB-like chromosome segregation protein Spo0J
VIIQKFPISKIRVPHKRVVHRDTFNSVLQMGILEPISVSPDLELYDGYTRLRALKHLGIKSVFCMVIRRRKILISRIQLGPEWRTPGPPHPALVKSLKIHGLIHPILVTENLKLLDGRYRLLVWKSLGHYKIMCDTLCQ